MIPFLVIKKPAAEVKVEVCGSITTRKQGKRIMLASNRKANQSAGSWAVSGIVDASGFQVMVDKGYVNAIEPVINGIPISGIMPDGTPVRQPVLYGSGDFVTVCLKITPNSSGKIDYDTQNHKLGTDKSLTVELVNGTPLFALSGDSWYHPLAAFDSNGLIAQIAYFDYFYEAYKPQGTQKWRHRMTVA